MLVGKTTDHIIIAVVSVRPYVDIQCATLRGVDIAIECVTIYSAITNIKRADTQQNVTPLRLIVKLQKQKGRSHYILY